jgi:lysophospholipase-like protein
MAFTKRLPFVGKIGLIGHSQGGAIAMLLSAELGKKNVKALGLLAPASTIHDILSQGVLFDATFDPLNVPEELSFFGGKVTVGKDYILSAQRCKLIEKARAYKGNVLVIHGTGDRMLSYTYSENLPYFYKHCKVSLIEKGDHLFTSKEAQAAEMMTQFMLKNLK